MTTPPVAALDPLHALRITLEGFAPLIAPGTPVLYLDYPNHFNVGDDLIFAGSRAFLAHCGARILGWQNWGTYHPKMLDRLPPEAVIVLHGGGNFGDVYDSFQAFREEVIARAPHHRIMAFPQSIHYASDANRDAASARLRRHRRLTIMCRDRDSLAMSLAHFSDDSILVPDMAHFLQPMFDARRKAGEGTMIFRRRDVESVDEAAARDQFDWGNLLGPIRKPFKIARLVQRLERKGLAPGGLGARAMITLQDRVIDSAIDALNRYKTIDTDRMHAMIMGLMLGKTVVARDNIYGKLTRYAQLWLPDAPGLTLLGKAR